MGVGTRHQPHSAHSCELALHAVGGARGRPGGGGGLLPACGASGVGRSPTPDRPSLGRAAGASYPLAVGAGGVGVGTRHRSRSAHSCGLALRAVGRHEGARGVGASCLLVGRPGLGALPRPTARPWSMRPGPTIHRLWVRRMWAWGPVTNPTARALARLAQKDPFVATLLDETESSVGLSREQSSSSERLRFPASEVEELDKS